METILKRSVDVLSELNKQLEENTGVVCKELYEYHIVKICNLLDNCSLACDTTNIEKALREAKEFLQSTPSF